MVERVTLYCAPSTVADADAVADGLAERVDAAVTVEGRLPSELADDDLAREFAEARVLSRTTGKPGTRWPASAGRGNAPSNTRSGPAASSTSGRRSRTPSGNAWRRRWTTSRSSTVWSARGRPRRPVAQARCGPRPARRPERGRTRRGACKAGGRRRRQAIPGTPVRWPAAPRGAGAAVDGQFLVARTMEALEGCALDASHYLALAEAFCADPGCRLYAAPPPPPARPGRRAGVLSERYGD
jgi:hypothetical protein